MKKFMGAAVFVAAMMSSSSAMAVASVGQDYTFVFSGNCLDCAEANESDAYPVQATLKVTNYELGQHLADENFVQFDYGGSILFPAYSITKAIFGGISGAIGATPGAYNVEIFGYPYYFSSSDTGNWETGTPRLTADIGNSGAWSIAPTNSAVPEPGTWAMMIAGFTLAGAAMRRRTKVRFDFA